MLALFGSPHLARVVDAYDETAPLAEGWKQRVPLHQMHPLLVHAVLFGGGYGARAADAARSLLDGTAGDTRLIRPPYPHYTIRVQSMNGESGRAYDLVVIGAGPVGENVAARARRGGLSVCIVESRLVGGECSYYACVPTKAMLRPVHALIASERLQGSRRPRCPPEECWTGVTRSPDGVTTAARSSG